MSLTSFFFFVLFVFKVFTRAPDSWVSSRVWKYMYNTINISIRIWINRCISKSWNTSVTMPFRVPGRYLFRRDVKTILTELFPLKLYWFLLTTAKDGTLPLAFFSVFLSTSLLFGFVCVGDSMKYFEISVPWRIDIYSQVNLMGSCWSWSVI